jgi:hypothetical protein
MSNTCISSRPPDVAMTANSVVGETSALVIVAPAAIVAGQMRAESRWAAVAWWADALNILLPSAEIAAVSSSSGLSQFCTNRRSLLSGSH